ncbi:MAG TPA: hypothetical protein GX747_04900 [Tenericutes bacterium]|nr:hypothetical protein [Mycoplasmatota bacterium]
MKKCLRVNKLIMFLDDVIGYEMDFFPNHRSFDDTLYDENINTTLRKKLSKYSILELKEMHENGFIHTDFHIGNIITDEKDILFIDPDSFTPKLMCDEKLYDSEKINDIKNSIIVSLSYIYKIDFITFTEGFLIDMAKKELHINSDLKEYILAAIHKDKSIKNTYIDVFLDKLDIDKVKYDQKNILDKYR